ncbi:MAG: hypothetical protein M3463_01965 [Verrucomicrobiota bacterium]|nr:hypothetical protein [Verrucomicrobiota bacterium]
MKHRPARRLRFTALIVLGLAILAGSALQARAQPPRWTVRVELMIVALPEAEAMMLVPPLREEATREAAMRKLWRSVAAGTAELIAWPVMQALDGEKMEGAGSLRFLAGSGEEVRYGTECVRCCPPTAYETRNTGVHLQCQPHLHEDGRTLLLDLVAEHVELLRFTRFRGETTYEGIRQFGEQPEFFRARVQTTVTVRTGEPLLLGVYQRPEAEERWELFILKASAKAHQESARHNP